jgi:hypothetical protein
MRDDSTSSTHSIFFRALPVGTTSACLHRRSSPSSHFKYRRTGKYLDSLVARIDALRLRDIGITSQPTFTQPEALSTRLGLQVSCEQFNWQLSSMSQICDHFFSLFSVENLGVNTEGPSNLPDDIDDEEWLRLICAFVAQKTFAWPAHLRQTFRVLYV